MKRSSQSAGSITAHWLFIIKAYSFNFYLKSRVIFYAHESQQREKLRSKANLLILFQTDQWESTIGPNILYFVLIACVAINRARCNVILYILTKFKIYWSFESAESQSGVPFQSDQSERSIETRCTFRSAGRRHRYKGRCAQAGIS